MKNLIVDDFQQFTFDDPATGQTLKYNLFVPKHYNPRKSYPLVLFMHDAGVVNVATKGPLVQGLGAVCWASPEDQARHEAFVLAPEYGSVVIDDTYLPSTLFDATANLVESVTGQYSIDPNRRYTTGQSMGAMMSLGLNIKYPDLFAAAFIVAGQWPEARRYRSRRRTSGSSSRPTTPRRTRASRRSPRSSRNRARRSAPRCGTGSPPPPSSRRTSAA
ncbi:alpha/beta hydrolase-fold protein [Streptomyces prunicolor]|uniref:carboxylesterase family protein n=1 Tax=Streptomyces prunicolor TaxID=67348 RepID=UPI00224E154B|nr:alpha/beta hydrolase-fold protein [Streptomyces prunicolor]MCX5235554.1 alpha/beta hydrolase-fold protein [Streptomyces prunicolor]